jgi:hypothetical protein
MRHDQRWYYLERDDTNLMGQELLKSDLKQINCRVKIIDGKSVIIFSSTLGWLSRQAKATSCRCCSRMEAEDLLLVRRREKSWDSAGLSQPATVAPRQDVARPGQGPRGRGALRGRAVTGSGAAAARAGAHETGHAGPEGVGWRRETGPWVRLAESFAETTGKRRKTRLVMVVRRN